MNNINKFFLSPCTKENLPLEFQISGERSTLHLLRRDLEHLYQKETEFLLDDTKLCAPCLAAIGILTGIDLLSKFYSNGKGGKRFKDFLIKIGNISEPKANFMWKFRNALEHSYSLYIDPESKKNITILTTPNTTWHEECDKSHNVFLGELKRLFLQLIDKYKKYLETDTSRELTFNDRYKKFGRFVIK